MSDSIETTSVLTPAPKTKKAPKAKSQEKKANAPKAKEKGLRPMQIKVLKLLAKAKGPLNRGKLYAALDIESGLNDVLGKNDPAKRAEADRTKYPSLLTLKMIKKLDLDIDGAIEIAYEITAAGRKAIEKL